MLQKLHLHPAYGRRKVLGVSASSNKSYINIGYKLQSFTVFEVKLSTIRIARNESDYLHD
jgi:hypothetical protein